MMGDESWRVGVGARGERGSNNEFLKSEVMRDRPNPHLSITKPHYSILCGGWESVVGVGMLRLKLLNIMFGYFILLSANS